MIISRLISLMPVNLLRILGYRLVRGYQISLAARIGFATVIAVKQARIGKVRIGRGNRFQGAFELEIKDGARIGQANTWLDSGQVVIGQATIGQHNRFKGPFGLKIADGARIVSGNVFECGSWALEDQFQDAGYARACTIGPGSLITNGHFFDTVGGFELGENSWIGGRDSQFWTHGAGVQDRSIVIGSHCYIGSAVRFAPGAQIGHHSLVALGSVVAGRFDHDHVLIGGSPARVIQENYEWKSNQIRGGST
ncbi:MAG: hypothetical protein ACOYZ7_11095 [Chloroflexota bacterium]